MGNPLGFKQYLLSWLILGSITLLQAMSGTRFIYSACSNLMKQQYGISRVQVNNLIVASESGKLFGCFPTAAREYLPEWMILVIGLMFGSVGYGVQYLSISTNYPSLSYWQILLFNGLAGNSICWINTYCNLLAAKNFKHTQDTVTELASSYSGLTGKIYTSLVEGIQGRKLVSQDSSKIYLLLSCLAPAAVGLAMALLNCVIEVGEYEEAKLFPFVFVIVIATGVYAFIQNTTQPFTQMSPQLRVISFMLVVMLPLVVALLMAAKHITLAKWGTHQDTNEGVKITVENHEMVVTDKMAVGNENKGLKELVKSVDFWLFYMMNMCGVTLGMVYLNNLEIISESQGYHKPLFLLATSSTFGFFGRIFSLIFTWYTRETSIISKPALMMLIMTSMPLAFFLLISSSRMCLYISTGIIATGLGAITPIVASSTSEFFSTSPNSLVNQTNIIPTNVPLGTLLFGYLASLNYDTQGSGDHNLCLGRFKCHHLTFTIWGFISSIGTLLSFSFYIRTRKNHSQKLY